jgi:lipoprotein-anchoring transpeptidase ErfK/SrfK
MRAHTVLLVVAIAVLLAWHTDVDAARQPRRARSAHRAESRTPALPCGDLVGFQVLLDRQGFSPGQIDGRTGANFSHALTALQTARNIPSTGEPDCDTWQALGGATAGPTLTTYALTDDDMKGPFEPRIPLRLPDQARLATLAYRSVEELIAERFHASPAMLARLNPDVRMAAGVSINVPAVPPFDPDTKPLHDAAVDDVAIQVSRDESALRATRSDGTLVFFAPVSSGSIHDPLPPGDWNVTGVRWHPVFHYNPGLFWDANPQDEKAAIKPGPNNPVGVVWIALNLDHYGLHGTPEPGHVGHTESHGCVRLTNWDAARVAALVKRGTPVSFR